MITSFKEFQNNKLVKVIEFSEIDCVFIFENDFAILFPDRGNCRECYKLDEYDIFISSLDYRYKRLYTNVPEVPIGRIINFISSYYNNGKNQKLLDLLQSVPQLQSPLNAWVEYRQKLDDNHKKQQEKIRREQYERLKAEFEKENT